MVAVAACDVAMVIDDTVPEELGDGAKPLLAREFIQPGGAEDLGDFRGGVLAQPFVTGDGTGKNGRFCARSHYNG